MGLNIEILEIFEKKIFANTKCEYHTRAIITQGLYFLNPLFEGQTRLLKGLSFWLDVRLVFKSGV